MNELLDAFNNVTRTLSEQYSKELRELRAKLANAMKFVPYPETMCGYCDPCAPDDTKALIELAARLHGRNLPAIEAEPIPPAPEAAQ